MPARPTGSLLVLKALITLDGSGLFDRLDPNADPQELRSLRLTCAELRQLVDCFGTKTLHIKVLSKDYPRNMNSSGRLMYAQLREAGAALGRYHARLTGPVLPRKLCISATTCCTSPARDVHGDGGESADQMTAYMAGYMSVAGVPAALARVTECCLASDAFNGPVQSGVWYALVPHLGRLAQLTLRFHGEHDPLPRARMLAMLPPSAQLHTLAVEYAGEQSVESCRKFLQRAPEVLQEHPIHELCLLLPSGLPRDELLRTLSRALPSLERMHITQRKTDGMPGTCFQWPLPGNTFPMLRSISYHTYGKTTCPYILLCQLDELLRDRPRLVHVGALRVLLTPHCLAKKARYMHVERAQSAAGGGLGQLFFGLGLFDEEPAWAGMLLQTQALPFMDGSGGQRATSPWSSSGEHYVYVRRGMESALSRLAALLRPVPPPLTCAQKRAPAEDSLLLTYM